MIKGLRKKFVLINMLLVAAIILVVFASLAVSNINGIRRSGEQSLEMLFSTLGANQWHVTARNEDWKEPLFVGDMTSSFVIEQRGASMLLIGFLQEEVDAQQILSAAMRAPEHEGVLKEFNLRYLRGTTPDGALKIAFIDHSVEQQRIAQTVISCIGFAVLSLTLFFFVSLFLSNWALRPVARAWQQQRRFLSDASHELKTPLTVILANIGILKKPENQTPQALEKWLESTEFEAEHMKGMVEQMLFLAQSDEGRDAQRLTEVVDLSALVEGAALNFEAVAYEAGASITTDIAPEITLQGESEALSRLVSILLDNAVKYTSGAKQITVTLRKDERIHLQIRNTAAPMQEQELLQIFDRFYRAEESRSASGYGLGLPIAATIAQSHGGTIFASNEAGCIVFEVRLPIEHKR